jgi:hypothetical protein
MVEPTAPQPQDNQQLPAQGTPPGAPQPANTDPLSQVVTGWLQHATQQVSNNPIVAAKNQAAQAALQPKPDVKEVGESTPAAQAQPAPGSFGDKLKGAFENVAGDLGDASHAQDTPRGGWLSAVTNTLKARSERKAQEAKDASVIAKNQAETVALHRNMFLQEKALNDAFQKSNEDYLDKRSINHDMDKGVSITALQQKMKDPNFLTTHTAYETGSEPVLDSNGMVKRQDGVPVTQPTYTIMTLATKDGQPDNIEVDAETSAAAKKYAGLNYPVGAKLTQGQDQALHNVTSATRNAVNTLESGNEGKAFSDEQLKTITPYLVGPDGHSDQTIIGAISHVPGNAYAGLKQWSENATSQLNALQDVAQKAKDNKDQAGYDAAVKASQQIQAEKSKIDGFMTSGAISEKQIAAYDKKQDEATGWVDKVLHDPNALSGDKASAIIPQIQTALAQSPDPLLKQKLTSALSTAQAAQENYFSDIKRKANADQLAKQGDPNSAGKALASGDVTLADLKTRVSTPEFILQSIDAAKKIDPKYNPADEVAFEKIANSPEGAKFFGSAKSLTEKDGSIDRLMSIASRMPDNSLPVLNKVQDWEELARGKGPLAGYAAAVLGVADDYGKVMGGGTASDSARDHALSLFAAAQTPEQRMEAVQATLGAVDSQIHGRVGRNKFLQRQYNTYDRSQYMPAPPSEQQNTQPQAGVQGAPKTAAGPADMKVRPQGTTNVQQGSDGKWYYFGANNKFLGAVPDQYQSLYK